MRYYKCENCSDKIYESGGQWYHLTSLSKICNVDDYSWDNPITDDSPRAKRKGLL